MSPYWQEQMSPWTRASQNISGRLMQLPALRAQAQTRAAMGQYYQARAGQEEAAAEEARARTGLINTQAGHITFGEKAATDLSDSSKALMTAAFALENARASGDKDAIAAAQKNYDAANADTTSKGARFSNMKIGDLAPLLNKMAAQRQILSGSTNQTEIGDLEGNAAIANNPANLGAKLINGGATKPPPPGVVNSAAQKLPAEIAQDVTSSQQIPVDPNTKKPFPLLIPPGAADRAQRLYTDLVSRGVPLAEAGPDVKSLVVGTNAAAVPNIVTNRPGTPAVHNTFSADVPAKPPVLGTNSYTLQPGGADQSVVQDLTNRFPGLGGTMVKYGFVPAANAPTNAPVSAGAGAGGAAMPAFNSASDVRAAYKAGTLDRDSASRILQAQFGMQ